MKYQYILNNQIIFQTDSAEDYLQYIIKNDKTHLKYSVMYNLLLKAGEYKCEMTTAQSEYQS